MKKLLPGVAALAALLCVSCGHVTFESNLNPQNFTDYFRPSSVKIIEPAYLEEHRHRDLGQISGLACQEKERDYIATEADARTAARLKAADLGANALTFGRCIRAEDTGTCKVSITCYAHAYAITDER